MVEITGDVAAAASATVSTKGGSLTATLKKSIRDQLGPIEGGQLAAAALTFDSGPALVLLGSAGAAPRLRVSRTAGNRYELVVEDAEEEVVDDLTAAFLTLKAHQFQQGGLHLTPPIDADTWLAEMEEVARMAVARAAEAG